MGDQLLLMAPAPAPDGSHIPSQFTEGCAAACNGPYAGHWSKTMIGYADEDSSFALELTYNYSVKSYQVGNDFSSITINRKDVFEAAVKAKVSTHTVCSRHMQPAGLPPGFHLGLPSALSPQLNPRPFRLALPPSGQGG